TKLIRAWIENQERSPLVGVGGVQNGLPPKNRRHFVHESEASDANGVKSYINHVQGESTFRPFPSAITSQCQIDQIEIPPFVVLMSLPADEG
ncbi:MAG: hypothetical protein NTY32_00540, partial [Bacteroidia bacterium]|nr:hypothetical protein [Bacteroidia bacterium]